MYLPEDYNVGISRDAARKKRKREGLFKRQDGKCYWCTQVMDLEPIKVTKMGNIKCNSAYATFEHLIPRSMGGKFQNNIVLAHASCNNKRSKRKWPHDPVYGNGRHHDKT